ncbi:hypothetical protein PanWU01x14_049280 [Parasponia andersonii]|uniref:Uncharacterized protein n=1 Tax=Parasponia andersonii TaxID=3476 RepID=A0A2P5DMJ9_PARAD|nr:hypothetical protein PanWU01x14_049280 [Parasponia andersonii]
MAGHGEVPQSAFLFRQVPFAEESLGEFVLHGPIHVVHEHVSLPILSVPSHEPRRVDGAHPPRRVLEVPRGSVHHDQVPLRVVHVTRQVLQRELTPGDSGVPHNLAVLRRTDPHELVSLVDLGVVFHVVRLQAGQTTPNLLDPGLVLLEEDRTAAVVEGGPHEAVVAQSEDEEVAGRLLLEDPHGDRDLLEGLLRGHVGRRIVDQGVGQRRWRFGAGLHQGLGGGTVECRRLIIVIVIILI